MNTTKLSNSNKAHLSKRPPMAKSTRGASSSNNCSVVSPWEELKSLKSALADLQAKRLSALRLYRDEKILRQQETNRAEELAAKIQALNSSKPDSLPVNTAKSLQTNSSCTSLSLQKFNSGRNSDNDHRPKPPITMQGSASAQSGSYLSIGGLMTKVSMVARLPPGFSTSLTWHSLSMTNILPPPPEIVAFLSPLSTNSICDTREGKDLQSKTDSRGPLQAPAPVLSKCPNSYEIPSTHGMQYSVPVSDDDNSAGSLEHAWNKMNGGAIEKVEDDREMFFNPCSEAGESCETGDHLKNVLEDRTSLSNNPPDCGAIESNTYEEINCRNHEKASLHTSGTSEPKTASEEGLPANSAVELSELRQRLRLAEIGAARACHELKLSTQLIADMKQQLDASTSACKEMINTIMEQERIITQLSGQQHNP